MYCPYCGKQLENNAAFCSYCGQPVSLEKNNKAPETTGKKSQNKPQKRHRSKRNGSKKIILICIMILLLAAVIGGGLLAWNSFHDSDNENEFAVYEDVNNALMQLTSSEDYNSVTTEEKAQLVLDELTKMENLGQIAADSVEYDCSVQLISYEYSDGVYGGVMLGNFAEGTSGTTSSSYLTTCSGSDYTVNNLPSVPDFGLDSYPYEEQDLRALIICDLGDDYSAYTELSQLFQSGWTNAYMNTDLETDGNVSFYRTGLSDYDIVVIQEHGLLYKDECMIFLQETTNFANYIAKSLDLALTSDGTDMLWDLKANRVAIILSGEDNMYHYCLLPTFFTYYYGNDLLEDCFVWLGCCDGYHNDALVSAFADCGAASVLATTETTSTIYNFLMQDAFVYMLLSGNTVEESLDFAKKTWGENDRDFSENYFDSQDDTPSEIRHFNGGDETLVTLTSEAKTAVTPAANETVLAEKLDELVSTYGLLDESQSGTMNSSSDDWFEPSGIMSANIEDFDSDGESEMMVCISELCDHYNDGSYHIMMYMWEVENERVVLADSFLYGSYIVSDFTERNIQEVTYTSANWIEEIITVNAVLVDGEYYFVCEDKELASSFGDGSLRNYWLLKYSANEFYYVCSFTQMGEASSDFEYIGYKFENGECISSQVYYTEWYDGSGLYEDYGTAMQAFFEAYGIQLKDIVVGYECTMDEFDEFTSILSTENDTIAIFEFLNQCNSRTLSSDYSSITADFTAVLTRGSELLVGFLDNDSELLTISGDDAESKNKSESEIVIVIE